MKFLNFLLLCLATFSSLKADLVSQMSLEEKMGQVLMVHFFGDEVNEEARRLVQGVKVGGIIYYNWANTLSSPLQVRNLSSSLQGLAEENSLCIPLLIAADQEGGRVARLREGFTLFPGNRALGLTGDLDLARQAAFVMGRELRAVGVNMNLAPVVDVNSNPKNPVIGARSFGEDPELVRDFGKSVLEGFKEAGVFTTLKHFPGHGDSDMDSHLDLPEIRKSKEELERVELFPFAHLAGFADAVMTAHLLVPALDPFHCSTLSEKTLKYLREEIGFKGLIVSDSLMMQGVLKRCFSLEEAALQALNAGCDLLILGGRLLVGEKTGFELKAVDVERIHHFLVDAVKTGRIQEERLDSAVRNILELKSRIVSEPFWGDLQEIHSAESQAIAEKISLLARQKEF